MHSSRFLDPTTGRNTVFTPTPDMQAHSILAPPPPSSPDPSYDCPSMEPNSSSASASASASAASGSRWNPSKDQIAILESLYRQGLRTPSTEQIKQITARLREFGTTEGKNVFYWFQNHKARQRQRMKQESLAYYGRMLGRGPTLPMPMAMPAAAVAVGGGGGGGGGVQCPRQGCSGNGRVDVANLEVLN